MATYYSGFAANRFSTTPRARANPENMGIPFRVGETFTFTTDHDSADVVVLLPIRSNWSVRQVLFSTDGTATAGAIDIGLYTIAADGTLTEVDKDLFASAQAITSALTFSDVTNESTGFPLNERFEPIWDVATAATEDPNVWYWLCATVTTNVNDTTVTGFDVVGVR